MVNQIDPRVVRTGQLIREAFRELLRQKGFDAITIKDIAERATINRATFYTHYEDKYALLEEIIEQAFQQMIPGQVEHAPAFTDEICNELILMTYRYILDFYEICRMDSKSIATRVDEKIKQLLQQIIERILIKGDDPQTADPNQTTILAAMTGSAIYSAAYQWFKTGYKERTDLLVDLVRPYVMNGLGLTHCCEEGGTQ